MTARQLMVVGMPSSGKSTFIAALRHVLLSDETASMLSMTRLAQDEKHLNLLQGRWLASQTFERTRQATEAWVRFHIQDRGSGVEAELLMPDLRGEVFERPAAAGECARDVYEAMTSSSGLLLFTSANRADDANLISDVGDLVDGDAGEAGQQDDADAHDGHGAGEPVGRRRPSFQADLMPEEAKIVELLQVVNRRPQRPRRRRLGVVVSAWDAVVEGGDPRSPDHWLLQERPMLSQFLTHNSEFWDVRVYGVSAQGGQLPRDEDRLQAIEKASERIMMVGADAEPHDPTAPLAWLMSGG